MTAEGWSVEDDEEESLDEESLDEESLGEESLEEESLEEEPLEEEPLEEDDELVPPDPDEVEVTALPLDAVRAGSRPAASWM